MAQTQEQPTAQRSEAAQAAETTQAQTVEEVAAADHPGMRSRGVATDQARHTAPRTSAAVGEAAAITQAAAVDSAGPAPVAPVAGGGTGPHTAIEGSHSATASVDGRGEGRTPCAPPVAAPAGPPAPGEGTGGPVIPNHDLTPLRDAIRYARATGWDHYMFGLIGDYGYTEHVWRHGDRHITWDGETLAIHRPQLRPSKWRPASLAEAVAVLEVAGLLPPAWSRS